MAGLATSRRFGMLAAGVLASCTIMSGLPWAGESATAESKPPKKTESKKDASSRASLAELKRLLAEQQALIEEQRRMIAEQQARIDAQQSRLSEQDAAMATQQAKLAALEERLLVMNRRLDEIQQELPAAEAQKALEERLSRIEQEAEKAPEVPPNVVSAGDFPGSIRIPGTDAAIKLGGRIRTALVFTLDPLGSEDRFLTNSIPVLPTDEAAGKGRRTTFSANTSRFNFEMRTPTGAGHVRTFIEGDFFGSTGIEQRTAFRLRHAYAQFRGFIIGQTWSTFSDPVADHQALDFEGINGENVIRQAQIRWFKLLREDLTLAVAAETPEVSLTDGEGVNVVPDIIGRVIWRFKEIGHLQGAVVLREIRGEPDPPATGSEQAFAWGASLSGVVPFRYFSLTDRLIYQLNFGKGIARYINDLNSLGGQDAVFDEETGRLEPLGAVGWYVDYEHQWGEWEKARVMKLRSSLIWSFVNVDNLDSQPPEAYQRTNRLSVNLVFSPIERIDMGVEYIYGTRTNNDGEKAAASQVQAVAIFRF